MAENPSSESWPLERTWYTWYSFCHFYKGDTFCNFLFDFLHAKPLLVIYSKRKEFAPKGGGGGQGANSSLLEQIPFQKEEKKKQKKKQFWQSCIPWKK